MDGSKDEARDEQRNEDVEELALDPVAVVHKRRPRALWAVLAVVAVAAGALVVTSADDEGNQRPGLPVDLAGASSASGEAAAADASMRAWVTYVPGDDLPTLGGEATAYRLSGEVDESQVATLADALGLEGEVQSDDAGVWVDVGGAGRLDVYSGSGASWSYFGGERDCVTEDGSVGGCCDPGEACKTFSSTGTAIASCPESTDDVAVDCAVVPTTSIPDDTSAELPALEGEDEARAAALEVVAASGADVDDALVTVESGGESRSWYVTVELVVGGVPSGLLSYFEVSEDARVLSGNGYLGQPEALGEYPLLDTHAVIDRANAQSDIPSGIEPALGAPGAASGGSGTTTVDPDAPVSTVVGSTDPCAAPDGASDGCGGTTGCGGDACNDVGVAEDPPVTTMPCKVQPDGREICEYVDGYDCGGTAGGTDDGTVTTLACEVLPCPLAEPGDDIAVGAPESLDCAPPPPDPGVDPIPDPLPEPQPIEIVLVEAEPSLVLLPATDGSGDAYLVPAYRFTAEDGGTVDLPAVADEALAGSSSTETTVPATDPPQPVPVPEPQPCEVLEEGDSSATTHTVQTCPDPEQDALEIGGDGYYVDIDVECAGGTFALGGRIWITDDEDVAGWADPGERHEGGTFTLEAEDHGTFVGNAAGTLTAEFRRLGPAEDIFCTPEPR